MLKYSPLSVFLLFALACSADPLGSAPEISDLMYSPSSIASGQLATVQGTLLFADEDGDLLEMFISLRDPAGNKTELPATEIADARGKTAGILNLQLTLMLPAPGQYSFEVRLVDENGNESNPASGSIVAE